MTFTAAIPTPGAHAVKLVSLNSEEWSFIGVCADTSTEDLSPEQGVQAVGLLRNLYHQPDLLASFNQNAMDAARHTLCAKELAAKDVTIVATAQALATLQGNNTTVTASSQKYDRIPDPLGFEKGCAEYRAFKAKLWEKLQGDDAHFRDEAHKVSYTMGLLKGQAYEQVSPLRLSGGITTVQELMTFLDACFEDPNPKGTAEREL